MTDSTAQRPAVHIYWLLNHYRCVVHKNAHFFVWIQIKQKGANNIIRAIEFYEYKTCFQNLKRQQQFLQIYILIIIFY